MYLTGETFSYEINDEDKDFTVIGDAMIKGKEYIIAENENNKNFCVSKISNYRMPKSGELTINDFLNVSFTYCSIFPLYFLLLIVVYMSGINSFVASLA